MKKGFFYSLVRLICIPVFSLLYRCEINGANCLPESGKFILCSNHLSLIDPILLIISQKRKIRFMAKSELFSNGFLARIFYMMGAFPVHRGKGDTKAISTAEELLTNGEILGIFFEGTRSKDGNLLKPKPGVAMISYQTQTPIIPVCISAKGGGKIRMFKPVIVSYGDPISPEALGLENGTGTEFRQACRKLMENVSAMRERDIGEI